MIMFDLIYLNVDKFNSLLMFCYVYFLYVTFRV